MTHHDDCPARLDADARCDCAELELRDTAQAVADYNRATQPSAAELMRRAKEKGFVTPQPGYA